MNISDSRYNSREHYTAKLLDELRKLVEHPDGLDPEDCLIYSIEHLMNCFVVLNDQNLIAGQLVDAETATNWREDFCERFKDSSLAEVSGEILASFDRFVEICNDA